LVSGKNVDVVITDNYSWHELKDNSFDVVISGQTLEHVGAPWLWFSEVKRVLCVGGLCCVIAPSAGPEHKYPVDCYRFYTDGLIFLAEYVGLKVLRCHTNNVYPWRDSVLVAKKI
jgi:ubiquinone/menaquinone biosynthesis C-methylase UbiE